MNLWMTQWKALRSSNKQHHNIILALCIYTIMLVCFADKNRKINNQKFLHILIVVLMVFIHRIPLVDKRRNRSWSRRCGVCSWSWALRSWGQREAPATFFNAKTVIEKKMIKVIPFPFTVNSNTVLLASTSSLYISSVWCGVSVDSTISSTFTGVSTQVIWIELWKRFIFHQNLLLLK